MGYGVPSWVEKDLRAYLRCGILAHGFARVRCEDCGHERLLAFSCATRGVCPSCNTRRMAEVAAHVTDHVLPHLPVRQWVLSLPKRLRPFLEGSPDIASAVLRIFIRAVRTTLCRTSPGAPRDAQVGALSFLHRFGASLNAHFHFHVVVLDGVFSHASDGEVRFHEAARLMPEHWDELQHVVQSRVLRYFHRHDLLDEVDAHGMLSWQGSGGFSIDASVHIEGDDRAGVERLLRYCARPPFALERLYAPAGIVSLGSGHPPEVGRQARLSPTQAGARRPHRAPALSDSASRAASSFRHTPTRPPPPVSRRSRAECQTPYRRHLHRQTRRRDTRRSAPEPNRHEPKAAALPRC